MERFSNEKVLEHLFDDDFYLSDDYSSNHLRACYTLLFSTKFLS